jgi:hypothetical protein
VAPPDNNFLTAAAVARMFETNHRILLTQIQAVAFRTDNAQTGGALLQWIALASVTSYRVEYSTNPGGVGSR